MPAKTRQLLMGVLDETERARIVTHLTDRFGDVSKGLRALVSASMETFGEPGLPMLAHGKGREKPQVWVWPTSEKRRPFATIYCRRSDYPPLASLDFVEAISQDDDPDLYALATSHPSEIIYLRRNKGGTWEKAGQF